MKSPAGKFGLVVIIVCQDPPGIREVLFYRGGDVVFLLQPGAVVKRKVIAGASTVLSLPLAFFECAL